MKLENLTITRAHWGLVKKEFSAVELAKAYLDKIENFDKKIFTFLTLTKERALSQARRIDDLISEKRELSIIAGIPIAIKDNILLKDVRCTAGSKILADYVAPYSASVLEKLQLKGAVFLGKTNPDEFAMGSSTENSAFGPTRNPHNLNYVPGGSSGGSAAAVAADFCVSALGSDTGGSIRLPASFCGVVGFKPTYGTVSRYGLIAFASSLDQIGPLAKNVEDARIIFEAIKGEDKMDSTSVDLPDIKNLEVTSRSGPRSWRAGGIKNLRIGVPKEYFIKGIDARVEKIIKGIIKKYERAGGKIIEVSLPHTEQALSCYYIISTSEASANLARYDGIKYGYSEVKNLKSRAENLLDVYLYSRSKGFGNEVKRRIMLGTYALSSGYYQAYYLRAQKVRTLIKQDFDKVFKKVDAIVSPVSPTPPFKIGEKVEDPLSMYLSDVYTVPVNLAGLPAISIPAGFINNLPVGLQIIGQSFQDNKVLKIAEIFEKVIGPVRKSIKWKI